MQSTKKVSVIIPAYHGADLLGETIQSVLDQTYPYWELLVVDDRSPDHTPDVVHQFTDPRVKYLRHEENRGADMARWTGLQASTGEIIAFLDQDDLFHREKLASHVLFLEQHPAVGLTYNARFDLNHSAHSIRQLWRPPQTITLADVVLGFPLSPSDLVLRREWACREDIWEIDIQGSEIVFLGRLFFAGCQFGFVARALNYRRYHGGRQLRNLAAKCADERRCQEIIFTDPRCTPTVVALRNAAHANLLLGWAYYALIQGETTLGHSLIQEARTLKPAILQGAPCEVVSTLAGNVLNDESQDYEQMVSTIAAQLLPITGHLTAQWQAVLRRGYLLKGVRALLWQQEADGLRFFTRARQLGAQIDEVFVNQFSHELLHYEAEFGGEATNRVVERIVQALAQVDKQANVRWVKGGFLVNQAFRHYHAAAYQKVPAAILRALFNQPRYMANRGVLSMFFQSLVRSTLQQKAVG